MSFFCILASILVGDDITLNQYFKLDYAQSSQKLQPVGCWSRILIKIPESKISLELKVDKDLLADVMLEFYVGADIKFVTNITSSTCENHHHSGKISLL